MLLLTLDRITRLGQPPDKLWFRYAAVVFRLQPECLSPPFGTRPPAATTSFEAISRFRTAPGSLEAVIRRLAGQQVVNATNQTVRRATHVAFSPHAFPRGETMHRGSTTKRHRSDFGCGDDACRQGCMALASRVRLHGHCNIDIRQLMVMLHKVGRRTFRKLHFHGACLSVDTLPASRR